MKDLLLHPRHIRVGIRVPLHSDQRQFLDSYSGTTSMSYIWKSWILFFAASVLASSESSEDVSLECNETVTVVTGDTAILNCNITYHNNNCNTCVEYCYGNEANKCYSCEQNSTVSVTISNVTMNETYTVTVSTDCGVDDSTIKVKVKPRSPPPADQDEPVNPENSKQDPKDHVVSVLLSTVIAVCVFGILCFLLGRKIVRRIMPKKPHEISVEPADEEEFLSASQTLQP